MHEGFKIAIGTGVAALMAVTAHGPLGMGARFVAGLEQQADAAMTEAGLSGLTVRFPTNPLSRTAIISGSAPGAEQRLAVAALSGISGIKAVHSVARPGTGETETVQSALPETAQQRPVPEAPPPTAAPRPAQKAPPAAAPPRLAGAASCQSSSGKTVAGRTLSFRAGSAYLSPQSNHVIHEVAETLKACPALHVEIGSHSNTNGNAAVPMSEERLRRVHEALLANGVSPAALSAKDYGGSNPINARDATNPANRRVVFTVREGGA